MFCGLFLDEQSLFLSVSTEQLHKGALIFPHAI